MARFNRPFLQSLLHEAPFFSAAACVSRVVEILDQSIKESKLDEKKNKSADHIMEKYTFSEWRTK